MIGWMATPRQGGALLPPTQRHPMSEIQMPDLQGSMWNLQEHRGHVMLVNFWATWCPPCRHEIPLLTRLAQDAGVDIAGIAMDYNDDLVRRYVAEMSVSYPVLLPPSRFPLGDALQGLPTTFLVDRQGRVAKLYVGELSERDAREDIARLLLEQ